MTGAAAGAVCPGCGAARGPGGTPACGCARAAARAALATRSAQAAAAEDFDPLRIRPYVTLPEPTAPLPALSWGAGGTPGTPGTVGTPGGAGAPGAAPHREARPAPGLDGSTAVSAGRERRRSRAALFSGAGMLAASAAVFAGGMYTGGEGGSDGGGGRPDLALPDTASSAPDQPEADQPDRGAEKPVAQTSVKSARPAPEPTRTERSAPSPAPSPSTASPRTLREPATSPTRTTARATGTVILPPTQRPQAFRALRLGDRGPGVTELQNRLGQVRLYVGPRDGAYSPAVAGAVASYQWARGVTDDPPGTYGRATRRALEAETTAP